MSALALLSVAHLRWIESIVGRLKDWRRPAARYDRCAPTFSSAISIAATVTFWLAQRDLNPGDHHCAVAAALAAAARTGGLALAHARDPVRREASRKGRCCRSRTGEGASVGSQSAMSSQVRRPMWMIWHMRAQPCRSWPMMPPATPVSRLHHQDLGSDTWPESCCAPAGMRPRPVRGPLPGNPSALSLLPLIPPHPAASAPARRCSRRPTGSSCR